jgi:hypothetical protein
MENDLMKKPQIKHPFALIFLLLFVCIGCEKKGSEITTKNDSTGLVKAMVIHEHEANSPLLDSGDYYHETQDVFSATLHDSVIKFFLPYFLLPDTFITYMEIDHRSDTTYIPMKVELQSHYQASFIPVSTPLHLSKEWPKSKDKNSESKEIGAPIFSGKETRDLLGNPLWAGSFTPMASNNATSQYSAQRVSFKYNSLFDIGFEKDTLMIHALGEAFSKAVLEDNRQAVAELLSFPLRINWKRTTKENFLKNYEKIFTKKFKEKIPDLCKEVIMVSGDWSLGDDVWVRGEWNNWKICQIDNIE